VLSGVTVGLLFVELAVRASGLAVLPSPRRAVYAGQSNEWCCGPEVMVKGVHRFEPNTVFAHCYSGTPQEFFDADGCVTYRINLWGYRGSDFAGEKRADTFRIVILGDSFTFGEGTPEHQIYPVLVGRELASRRIAGRRIEVINLGIPAEDAASELRTYLGFARHLNPDWVVLQWSTNDFPSRQVQEEHLRLIGVDYRHVFSDTRRHPWSHLLRFLRTRARMRQISDGLIAATLQDADAGSTSFEDIGRLRDAAEQDRAGFSLLAFPELIRFDDYPYAAILQGLGDYCRSRQIALINLLPALSVREDRDLWVHETDHHPNPTAHAIAAERLLKEITLPPHH
jgi:hypothetical protein